MKIQFLGTAAAEGIPALWCRCENCVRSRKAGGAGLGLSLCVEIAKRHNARITAKSRPGVGTAVYVTVPWAKIGGAVGDEK